MNKALLRQYLSPNTSVLFALLSGFFVFYFLFFLEAYGIQRGLSYSGHSHLFRSLSFGLLTLLYIGIFETWVKPKLNVSSYKHEVLWYTGLILLGSHLTFILFNYFWNWQEMDFIAYGLIMKEYPMMMILPIVIYQLALKILNTKNTEEIIFLFQSDNGKNQLKIKLEDFLYANSSDNYIQIHYKNNGNLRQHLLRKPLKVLEQELKTYPHIQKSHRSYIINQQNIDLIKQEKGKVLIDIHGVTIPVSKQFSHLFI